MQAKRASTSVLSLSLSLADRASKQIALAHTSVLELAIQGLQTENIEKIDSHVNTFDASKSRRYGTVHTLCGRRRAQEGGQQASRRRSTQRTRLQEATSARVKDVTSEMPSECQPYSTVHARQSTYASVRTKTTDKLSHRHCVMKLASCWTDQS